jgi:site-specific DNA-methyltransferase (adenine-specific)
LPDGELQKRGGGGIGRRLDADKLKISSRYDLVATVVFVLNREGWKECIVTLVARISCRVTTPARRSNPCPPQNYFERLNMLELNKLYLMNCMEGMAQFPDKYFELAIVDPPYGIGKFTCDAHTTADGKRIKNIKSYNDNYTWNDEGPSQAYFDELKRVSVRRIIWGANYYNCFESGHGALVWYKGSMTETISHCEIASLNFQKRVSYVHIGWQSGFLRKVKEGEQIHPCQKPIELYRWLLSKYAIKGDKILDTHVGSASSLIACIDYGFDFMGFEIDKDYYEAAQRRIDDFKAQDKLF